VIQVAAGALHAIRRHGREAYPEECCGALLGSATEPIPRVTRAEPLANTRREERQRRYGIAPEDYRRIESEADRQGLALLGFYHSHPDHPAAPSAYDREYALPFFHYLVLAVASGRPGELTSWVLSEDRGVFEAEELMLEDAEE
jgi:proteasome lid subunit RPN8/RPN11